VLKTLHTFSTQRRFWLLLTVLALALEGCALYLQHVLGVEPCNECIYIRAGVLGVAVAGLIGTVAPSYWPMRLLALCAWMGALGWSLARVVLLLDLERIVRAGGEASCKRFKGFPDWLPLEKWLPNVFEPRAMCGTVSWTFLGQSVTFWIGIALAALAVLAVATVLAQLRPRKSRF
jgi:disulfide bond formation protein DsbB